MSGANTGAAARAIRLLSEFRSNDRSYVSFIFLRVSDCANLPKV